MAVRTARTMLLLIGLFGLPFVAIGLGWRPWNTGGVMYGIGLTVWLLGFNALFIIFGMRANRRWKQLIADEVSAGTERLPENGMQRWLLQWEGRNWTSRTKLFGLPLVQVAFSHLGQHWQMQGDQQPEAKVAKAWIAIGEKAYGVLFAMGSQA